MRKIYTTTLLCSLLLLCSACTSVAEDINSQESSSASTVSEQISVSSEELSSSDNSLELVVPIISGSQAYDIILSLDENGVPQPETQEVSDGYMWSATTSEYSYIINSDANHAVSAASFMVLSETADTAFLSFCASMPYDNADTDVASTWVQENIGNEATTTIGDAVFTLSVGTEGLPILDIKAIGRDDYLISKLS